MSFVHEDLRHGEGIELVDIPTRDMTEADSRISEKSALSTTANNRERKRAGLTTVPQVSELFCKDLLSGFFCATNSVG